MTDRTLSPTVHSFTEDKRWSNSSPDDYEISSSPTCRFSPDQGHASQRAEPIPTTQRALPRQVLAAIFVAGYHASSPSPFDIPFEIKITQVCRQWRAIATNLPLLWSRISASLQKPTSIINKYLIRSGTLLLDLHLDVGQRYSSRTSHALLEDLYGTFSPHINRWRRLYIGYDSTYHLYALLQCLTKASAPRLETIQIRRAPPDEFFYEEHIPELYHIFRGGAPSLKHVRVRGLSLHCCLPPMSTITTLELHPTTRSEDNHNILLTYAQFISTLSNCSRLSSLLITGDLFNEPKRVTQYIPSTHLPHLRLLRITKAPGRTIDSLLRVITAPLLEELIMEGITARNLEQAFEPWGSSMHIARLASVRSLALKVSTPLDRRAMRRISQALPSISRLTLVGQRPQGIISFLDRFDTSTGAFPWPLLNSISLDRVSFNRSRTSIILDKANVLHRDGIR